MYNYNKLNNKQNVYTFILDFESIGYSDESQVECCDLFAVIEYELRCNTSAKKYDLSSATK